MCGHDGGYRRAGAAALNVCGSCGRGCGGKLLATAQQQADHQAQIGGQWFDGGGERRGQRRLDLIKQCAATMEATVARALPRSMFAAVAAAVAVARSWRPRSNKRTTKLRSV